LAALSLLVYATPLFEACARIALAYAVIWLALVPGGVIRAFNRAGDYSYGIYITCFPVQQTLVMLDPAVAPGALLAISFPAVLGLAMLSWHFIEHPALRQKEWVGARLAGVLDAARPKRGLGLLSRA
jgi:peptidoglycan/LPS O-acetylase OafA/YrhL